MIKMRMSSLSLVIIFCLFLGLLLIYRSVLLTAHIDRTIEYVASDAATYYGAYLNLFSKISLKETPALFLVGSPILLMNLVNGNLFLIQLFQLILMVISLRVGTNCFITLRGRVAFITGAMVFPYFLFGFLSLNKEIYAMCSAIFFASYVVRGNFRHMVTALILAMCARYYMLLALVAILVLIPPSGPPRYRLIGALLIFISIAAPFVKMFVPGYSSEGLLDAPGVTGILFSKLIDSFGYALVYPIKYLTLIPIRAYSFLIDPSRVTNGMEAVVSLASLAVLLLALYIVLLKKPTNALVKRLILIAFVAPIPIMWTEIMHWRYFSFVYFFFLFAAILHFVDRPRRPSVQLIEVSIA
jgi:hypothetical protein